MREEELRQLEKPENWDFDKAVKKPPVKPDRVVVSVSLSRGDFDEISKRAEQMNMRTSEFIRKAALGAAKHESRSFASLAGGGQRGSVFANSLSCTTLTLGTEALTPEEPKPSATY